MAQAKKKKKFWNVEMPIIKKETQLYALNIEELENKIIKYDLTRILKGKCILMDLKVSVKDKKATAKPLKLKLLPSFLKRMIRKNTNYIEDSILTSSKKDDILVKPFLITRRKVSKKVRKALGEKAREEIIEYCKKTDTDSIFNDILKNKLQKDLSLKLKKIYPLSLCEIRILQIKNKKQE
jgi:ribosomal protein S3AE